MAPFLPMIFGWYLGSTLTVSLKPRNAWEKGEESSGYWLVRGRSLAQTSAALARSTRSSCSACSSFTLSRRPVFARSTLGTRPVILMTSDCCSGCGTEIFTWSTEDKGGGESRQGRRVIWLPDDQRAGLHWCTGGSSVGDLASALAGSLAYLAGLLWGWGGRDLVCCCKLIGGRMGLKIHIFLKNDIALINKGKS